MKKILALSLVALMMLSLAACGSDDEAQTDDQTEETVSDNVVSYDNYSFEYGTNEDGNFEILGCVYSGADSVSIVIPSEIENRPVTGIAADAFKSMTAMTSVTIPDSIKYIGDFAFYCCTGLTSITVPNSVTEIGIGAFWGCSNVTAITVSNKLETLGDYAFWSCNKVASVTLPETLKIIGDGAFWNCEALTEISVPASVTSIGKGAFIYCSALNKATVLSSTVELGEGVFKFCSNNLTLVGTADENNTVKAYADAEDITFEVLPAAE